MIDSYLLLQATPTTPRREFEADILWRTFVAVGHLPYIVIGSMTIGLFLVVARIIRRIDDEGGIGMPDRTTSCHSLTRPARGKVISSEKSTSSPEAKVTFRDFSLEEVCRLVLRAVGKSSCHLMKETWGIGSELS